MARNLGFLILLLSISWICVSSSISDPISDVHRSAASESDASVLIPLIQSLQSTVISHTREDKLKVRVTTVLGSAVPPLSVKLMQMFSSGSKDASIIDQELTFDSENGIHILEALPGSVDVGKYIFVFEIVLHDAEHKKIYATGGRTKVPIFVTGVVKVDNAKIAVLDSDLGSVETQKKLSLDGENSISLSANHLQKLRVSFQLSTPLGNTFNPHQAFLKLTHETKVEHIFMVGSSGKQFTVVLDFLGLVEKFFYLSGRYDIQLTVGDAVMENSFMQALGHVELDLPEAPEKATRPPPQSVDPYLRYGPKDKIAHIFRTPEKLPRQELSLAFSCLILFPFIGFLVGLMAWCEPEEFPYINCSCHICHSLPRRHWSCSLSIRPLLDKAGSFYNIESTWILGDLFDVCGTQDSVPHCLNFSQGKICLSRICSQTGSSL